MKLYEIYAFDELWDKTSCPWGTEVLSPKAYGGKTYAGDLMELNVYDLCEQLTAAKIEYIETNKSLLTEMQWEDADYNNSVEVHCFIYVYKGYIYNVRMAWSDGSTGYTMSREPQFNKKYL